MTRARLTMIVLGGALLTSWLVAAAGVFQQVPIAPVGPPPYQPSDVELLAARVREQADRLRSRLEPPPALPDVVRNPFAFAPPRREAPRPVASAAAVPPPLQTPAPPAPAAPALGLVAIVTDAGARRAVLTVAGEITIVSIGDTVANRYRVAAISVDVVELDDNRGGPALRLGLR